MHLCILFRYSVFVFLFTGTGTFICVPLCAIERTLFTSGRLYVRIKSSPGHRLIFTAHTILFVPVVWVAISSVESFLHPVDVVSNMSFILSSLAARCLHSNHWYLFSELLKITAYRSNTLLPHLHHMPDVLRSMFMLFITNDRACVRDVASSRLHCSLIEVKRKVKWWIISDWLTPSRLVHYLVVLICPFLLLAKQQETCIAWYLTYWLVQFFGARQYK